METMTYTELCEEIAGMIRDLGRVVVAIEGEPFAGKTALSDALAARFADSAVIRMQDFHMQDPAAKGEKGMDFQRFTDEVAMPIWKAQMPMWSPHDPVTGERLPPATCPETTSLLIIEGNYATHPAIPDIYDLRIFVTGDQTVLQARQSETDKVPDPETETYFSAYMTRELSDAVIDGSEPFMYREPENTDQTELLPYQKEDEKQ